MKILLNLYICEFYFKNTMFLSFFVILISILLIFIFLYFFFQNSLTETKVWFKWIGYSNSLTKNKLKLLQKNQKKKLLDPSHFFA